MYSLNYCEKKICYYLAKSGPLIIKFNTNLIFLGGQELKGDVVFLSSLSD